MAADLDRNARRLESWGLPTPATFAYPYGDVGSAVKRLAHQRFTFARGVHRGDLGRGSDLNQAPAVAMDGPAGEASARDAIESAAERGRWLVLFGHAVQPRRDEFAIAPDALARLAGFARERGLEIVTARAGAEHWRAT